MVLPVLGRDDDDEVLPRRIVGMQQVGDDPEQSQTPGEDEQLIFISQFAEDVLLVGLAVR